MADKLLKPRLRVLIADDSIASRRALVEFLKRMGPFELAQVTDGQDALTELEAGDFNLLLTDRDMPNMGGMQLIQKVRSDKQFDDLKIVLITSHSAKRGVAEALKAGANDYVLKPFDPAVMSLRLLYLMQADRVQPEISDDKLNVLPDPVSQGAIDALLYPGQKMTGPPPVFEQTNAEFKPLEPEQVKDVDPQKESQLDEPKRGILGQKEIDALLVAADPPPPVNKPIIRYDFKHPQRVSKDQQRTLENLHSNLGRMMASGFSTIQRSVVDCDIAFVDQTTYAEFIMSLSNPSCSYTFTIEPLGGPAIIDFSLPISYAFIDRQFGGFGNSKNTKARPMTAVERTVMGKVVTRMLADLEATWEALLKIRVSDAELETNPEFMQVAAPSDTVILIAFEINMQHASGLVNVCYPYFTLEPVMSYLNILTWASRRQKHRPESRQARLDQLRSIEAEVSAVCGRGRVSADEVANLQVGDTLVLETRPDEPAVVMVEDLPMFFAQPGVSERGQYALEILRSIPQEKVRNYID